MILSFPWKLQKCRHGLSSFAVFLWHSMGCRQECWPSTRKVLQKITTTDHFFSLASFANPAYFICSFLRNGTGFVAPEFVDSDFPRIDRIPPSISGAQSQAQEEEDL